MPEKLDQHLDCGKYAASGQQNPFGPLEGLFMSGATAFNRGDSPGFAIAVKRGHLVLQNGQVRQHLCLKFSHKGLFIGMRPGKYILFGRID